MALVGDDPGAKSSTLPSASEQILADLAMPVLFPRNLADVVDRAPGESMTMERRFSNS